MVLADIYEVTPVQVWSGTGEQTMSRYYYRKGGTGISAAALAAQFILEGNPGYQMLQLQTDNMQGKSIRVINLGDFGDFIELAWTADGIDVEANTLPVVVAVGYSLRLDTREIRPGSKRISGIPDGQDTDGVLTNAPYLVFVEDMRQALLATIEDGGWSADPVVIKRVLRAPDETHPKSRYTLPETDGELVVGNVVNVLTSPILTHQISRGNGR
jgi:hypothetical protein